MFFWQPGASLYLGGQLFINPIHRILSKTLVFVDLNYAVLGPDWVCVYENISIEKKDYLFFPKKNDRFTSHTSPSSDLLHQFGFHSLGFSQRDLEETFFAWNISKCQFSDIISVCNYMPRPLTL